MALAHYKAVSLELINGAGNCFARGGDHLRKQIMCYWELEPDAVGMDSPELPCQLHELPANPIDVADVSEVAQRILPQPQRGFESPEERPRYAGYRQQAFERVERKYGDRGVGERV